MIRTTELIEYVERKKKDLVTASGQDRDKIHTQISRAFLEWYDNGGLK